MRTRLSLCAIKTEWMLMHDQNWWNIMQSWAWSFAYISFVFFFSRSLLLSLINRFSKRWQQHSLHMLQLQTKSTVNGKRSSSAHGWINEKRHFMCMSMVKISGHWMAEFGKIRKNQCTTEAQRQFTFKLITLLAVFDISWDFQLMHETIEIVRINEIARQTYFFFP